MEIEIESGEGMGNFKRQFRCFHPNVGEIDEMCECGAVRTVTKIEKALNNRGVLLNAVRYTTIVKGVEYAVGYWQEE